MVTAPTRPPITADEFLEMPESEGHELVCGELVEVAVGAESSWVAGELHRRIANFIIDQGLGLAFPQETGMQIWADRPNHVRKADVTFVRAGRLPGRPPRGWLTVVPDLVVEVVSPNDLADRLQQKLLDYQHAGIPMIWVIYPESESAHIIRRGHPRLEIGLDGALDGFDVLLGFTCPLGELLGAAGEG